MKVYIVIVKNIGTDERSNFMFTTEKLRDDFLRVLKDKHSEEYEWIHSLEKVDFTDVL